MKTDSLELEIFEYLNKRLDKEIKEKFSGGIAMREFLHHVADFIRENYTTRSQKILADTIKDRAIIEKETTVEEKILEFNKELEQI